jgi:hypothetical protein
MNAFETSYSVPRCHLRDVLSGEMHMMESNRDGRRPILKKIRFPLALFGADKNGGLRVATRGRKDYACGHS